MSDNSDAWRPLLAELHERTATARSMGAVAKIERQHSRGRQTVRERINALCDTDSYREIGALAGGNPPSGGAAVPCDAVVGGVGRIDGRSAVVLAEDFTVMGGSIGHANAAKRARLVRLATEQALPLVLMLDGAGERASNGTERYAMAPSDLALLADIKGQVPVVALIMGNSAGHGALTGMFADFIIITEGSALFTAGPPLVKAALGLDATPEQLGGARMHASKSGVVHNLAASEAEAIAMARYFLSLLPTRAGEALPSLAGADIAKPRRVDRLLDLIPPQLNIPFDIREVLNELVDAQTLFELQPLFGASLITAMARIGGTPCMIIANQPAVLAGSITTNAADKATHFIEVAGSFGLPLINLIDNPGVMPGPQSEQAGILKAAGRMYAAQRRYRGKKIAVILRKAFGFGSSVMGLNPYDRQCAVIALPSVSLGGVPAIGGAQAARATGEEAEKMAEAQSGAWVPADAMVFDSVIEPAELRNEIIAALRR
ncbi:MAG: acetyl-CoA carboxylase carboxyltransferase component [Halieaceae bacterium]